MFDTFFGRWEVVVVAVKGWERMYGRFCGLLWDKYFSEGGFSALFPVLYLGVRRQQIRYGSNACSASERLILGSLWCEKANMSEFLQCGREIACN